MPNRKTNLTLENSVAIEGLSDAQLRRCPRVKKIINKTLNDVCVFYTYFEVLKKGDLGSEKMSLKMRRRIYNLMVTIKTEYGYPVLANKLDEAEKYLRI